MGNLKITFVGKYSYLNKIEYSIFISVCLYYCHKVKFNFFLFGICLDFTSQNF